MSNYERVLESGVRCTLDIDSVTWGQGEVVHVSHSHNSSKVWSIGRGDLDMNPDQLLPSVTLTWFTIRDDVIAHLHGRWNKWRRHGAHDSGNFVLSLCLFIPVLWACVYSLIILEFGLFRMKNNLKPFRHWNNVPHMQKDRELYDFTTSDGAAATLAHPHSDFNDRTGICSTARSLVCSAAVKVKHVLNMSIWWRH